MEGNEHSNDNYEVARALFTARTTGKRQHTRLVNNISKATRTRRLHSTIDDLMSQLDRQYDIAATAHDRYLIEAGIDPNDLNAIAWMDELRGSHNRFQINKSHVHGIILTIALSFVSGVTTSSTPSAQAASD